jgi:anion-transporting  ArsA/GET3 family ATPase
MVLANEVVQAFLNVAPGNRETGVLAKLGWLCEEFDLVVVDLPASGHAVSLLEAPGMMLRLFPTGPIHDAGQKAQAMIERDGCHLVLVCLPEEMVINETLETHALLQQAVPGLDSQVVVLNRSTTPSLTEEERALLVHLSSMVTEGPESELLWAGRWEDALEASTAEATERLSQEGRSLIYTPRLSQEGGSDQVVQQLAAALARSAKKDGATP